MCSLVVAERNDCAEFEGNQSIAIELLDEVYLKLPPLHQQLEPKSMQKEQVWNIETVTACWQHRKQKTINCF